MIPSTVYAVVVVFATAFLVLAFYAVSVTVRALAVLASGVDSLREDIKSVKPQGYHVTYMVIKDHDFNNARANVPGLERIRYGKEMLIQSRCVSFGPGSTARFVPEDMKVFLARSREDVDEITAIEILGVQELTAAELQANQEVINSMQGTVP